MSDPPLASLARLPRRAPLFAASLAAALAGAADARAGLLDEPPRLCTFKLDDPSAASLPLLETFHEADAERTTMFGVYAHGSWSGWRKAPWWALAWPPAAVSGEARGAVAGEIAEAPEAAAEAEWGEGAPGAPRRAGDDAFAAGEPLALPELALALVDGARAAGPTLFASTGPSFASDGFDALWAPAPKPIPWWKCRRRPVTFVRYGAERDAFQLLRCDGSVAPEALDRLTLIARPNGVARPGELLPDEPDDAAWQAGEWLPGVKLVHPRLLWALQRIADAFPWRAVYVYSGYRPAGSGDRAHPTSHNSRHASGRAVDIHLMGVPNAELFKVCRKLQDVGCGFYPNSKFVHVDVRPGTGHPFWIDASGPGEPARYVDAWPGVVERGGLAWDAKAMAEAEAAASCEGGSSCEGAPRPEGDGESSRAQEAE